MWVKSMNQHEILKSRREEYAEATRQALLSAARELFTKEGYQATNIEAIARAARVTRGAFYYYFEDKKALFDAVVVGLQVEAAQAIAAKARSVTPAWAQLRVGINAYLDACSEPAYRRLVIQEAPAILGTARARAIDETYTLALLMASLHALRRAGELECPDVDLLSRMLGAMICEVALLLPDSASPDQLQENADALIGRVLSAFRRA
jgi:AcrR family transcriptional regulator